MTKYIVGHISGTARQAENGAHVCLNPLKYSAHRYYLIKTCDNLTAEFPEKIKDRLNEGTESQLQKS